MIIIITKKTMQHEEKTKKPMEHEDDVATICNPSFRTIPKVLIKGVEDLKIKGQVEAIQTKVVLILARTLRRVLKTWGALSKVKLSAYTDVKYSQGVTIISILSRKFWDIWRSCHGETYINELLFLTNYFSPLIIINSIYIYRQHFLF